MLDRLHHLADAEGPAEDAGLSSRLTPEFIREIVEFIPAVWLGQEESFANQAEHREAYINYLLSRLAASATFVEEAIHAYTRGAAHAGHREAHEGSIADGKLADLVVLSANPLEADVDGLHEIAVLRTIVGGRDVYLAG